MSRREAKQAARQRQSTRQLIGLKALTDYSLVTEHGGEQVFFLLKPDNISVLPEAGIAARIYALMTVLKGVAELEFLCLNSRESFEANKRFLRQRMEAEEVPAVHHLLEADLRHLDQLQVQMASSREFLVVIRLDRENASEVFAYLNRMEKLLREQGFFCQTGGEGGHQTDIGRLFRAERDDGGVRGLRRGALGDPGGISSPLCLFFSGLGPQLRLVSCVPKRRGQAKETGQNGYI